MEKNTVVNIPEEQAPQGDAAVEAVQNEAAEQTPETGEITQDAAAQEKSASERFSHALKIRVSEERAKAEREIAKQFEPDVQFAKSVRRYFSGKADADIVKDLTEVQVQVFAQQKGISEELAREFLELKGGIATSQVQEKPAEPAQTSVSDTWMARLARQREAIQAQHGVDVVEDLSDEEEALVMRGEMDLNEVFALRSQREATPPVNRGMATKATPKDPADMTDAEYEAFREELRRKGKIDVRSD